MILAELSRALTRYGFEFGPSSPDAAKVLVACSGGLDSVVLAHATVKRLGASRVILGHVDHGVRPASHEDAAFVEAFARQLGAGFVSARLSPPSDAEAVLRTLRYQTLEGWRSALGARLILTAHTLEDQAETVLLGLIRTTSVRALRGMPVSRGAILRPLLRVPRREIRRYAARVRLVWREDPSNLEPRYLRNRIRKELLPLLERRYRAGITERLAQMTQNNIDVGAQSEGVLDQSAASKAPAVGNPDTQAQGSRAHPPFRSTEDLALHIVRSAWPTDRGRIPDGRDSAVFDAAVLIEPVVRRVQPGDRIRPFGMTGRRKLKEVLREAGILRHARADTMVVAGPDGEVLWVPGVVRSGYAPVGPETRDVWVFTVGKRSELQGDSSRVTLADSGRDGRGESTPLPHQTDVESESARERASESAKER
ncbi:MAG: tRNA lysidine(34) synthetase TilS [Deltaproteobacteria bacterium]|nr:tRNA lysidine(34) synthetase TilS [Deltaproteobacteria bacterium]